MTTRVRHGRSLSLRLSFVVATVSFVLVFAAAGTPIPLYNLYRAQDGITHSDLAMVSVAYFVAAATALLLSVSYTHLDVYKRQEPLRSWWAMAQSA